MNRDWKKGALEKEYFDDFYLRVKKGGEPTLAGKGLTYEQVVAVDVLLNKRILKFLKHGNIEWAIRTLKYQKDHIHTRRYMNYEGVVNKENMKSLYV